MRPGGVTPSTMDTENVTGYPVLISVRRKLNPRPRFRTPSVHHTLIHDVRAVGNGTPYGLCTVTHHAGVRHGSAEGRCRCLCRVRPLHVTGVHVSYIFAEVYGRPLLGSVHAGRGPVPSFITLDSRIAVVPIVYEIVAC